MGSHAHLPHHRERSQSPLKRRAKSAVGVSDTRKRRLPTQTAVLITCLALVALVFQERGAMVSGLPRANGIRLKFGPMEQGLNASTGQEVVAGEEPVAVRVEDGSGSTGKKEEVTEGEAKLAADTPTEHVPVQAPMDAAKVAETIAQKEAGRGAAVSLVKKLGFTERTALNFMHFHKTGGVSFKTSIFAVFDGKVKKNGQPVRVRDACYRRSVEGKEGQPSFDLWRCDWAPVWNMTEADRNQLDFVFGHQFHDNGVDAFLNQRDVRTFTVLRHPFDRKVSFFFHFFVRERNRSEQDVGFEEVRDFLLYDRVSDPSFQLGRDLGPHYMAGRLLSDGEKGYVGNWDHMYYLVNPGEEASVVERALQIVRNYLFVGLQNEGEAAKCMLGKTIEAFNEVNGVNSEGVESVDREAKVLNTGSYAWTAERIWEKLSQEERSIFEKKEAVDLAIYREGEKLHAQHVKMFGCEHRLQHPEHLRPSQ